MLYTAPSAAHQSFLYGSIALECGEVRAALRHFSDTYYQVDEPVLKMHAANHAGIATRILGKYDEAHGWIDTAFDELPLHENKIGIYQAALHRNRAAIYFEEFLEQKTAELHVRAESSLEDSDTALARNPLPYMQALMHAERAATASLRAFMLWHFGYTRASIATLRLSLHELRELDRHDYEFEALLRLVSVSPIDRLRFLPRGLKLVRDDDARVTGHRLKQLLSALRGVRPR